VGEVERAIERVARVVREHHRKLSDGDAPPDLDFRKIDQIMGAVGAWRGWEYHRVVQVYSPVEVLREWTLADVVMTANYLYLQDLLDSLH